MNSGGLKIEDSQNCIKNISENITNVYKNIKKYSKRNKDIKLCCVTKYSSIEEIREAINCGIKIIGESRIKESKEKFSILQNELKANNVELHLIGHLQSNKVKLAVQLFDLIQTIDSITLAEKINIEAKKTNKIQKIMLQVNISEETQKFGFNIKDFESSFKLINQMKNIEIVGVMGMAMNTNDKEKIRSCFKKLKNIADTFNIAEISMGMSHDYKIALEEGSTMIRLGSAIFRS